MEGTILKYTLGAVFFGATAIFVVKLGMLIITGIGLKVSAFFTSLVDGSNIELLWKGIKALLEGIRS